MIFIDGLLAISFRDNDVDDRTRRRKAKRGKQQVVAAIDWKAPELKHPSKWKKYQYDTE
ncbi:MAG TPA: hypothetical protein VL854_11875 [Nitrososphaeraceae archaeon]|nr:hypothetical protein [Nitrososphaeraceae archaeon]